MDIPIFATNVSDILDEDDDSFEYLREKNPQIEDPKVQGERNVEGGEDDDIPIAKIMKRITESVSKSQDKDTQEKAR